MRRVLYTDHDEFVCRWLENLVAGGHLPAGDVRCWDINEVTPDDVAGYTQVHFFCGIGGWPLALEMAGWGDRPVWTGSCPCQPFSSAARGRNGGIGDDRDVWPAWLRLIATGRPGTIFGEQVAQEDAWLDRLAGDVEALGYEVGAGVVPAVHLGADHLRRRIYFACHANRHSESGGPVDAEAPRLPWLERECQPVPAEDGLPGIMGRVRAAYGNAIVPQVATEFVAAYMECRRV